MEIIRFPLRLARDGLIHIKFIFVKYYYEEVLVYNNQKQAYKVTKEPFSNTIVISPAPEEEPKDKTSKPAEK